MRTFRIFLLLLICLSVGAGGVANAAMLCCWEKAASSAQMQSDSGEDMPCHDDGKGKAQSYDCQSCDCTQYLKINSLSLATADTETVPATVFDGAAAYVSPTPSFGFDHPPRPVS